MSPRSDPVIRSAVVGCGGIAAAHIPAIKKLDSIEIVGVCDRDEIRAQAATKEYGVSAAFTSFAEMLAQAKPDVVHILTPPQTHAPLAIQALEAGCHVLVEKPLGLELDEADAVLAAGEQAGRLVGVDYSLLWDPLFLKARREIDSGRLGRILHVEYMISDDYLDAVKGGYGRWALDLRGGVFADLLPHPLYVIQSLLPAAQVASVRANGADFQDLRELWVDLAAPGAGAHLWMSLTHRPIQHAVWIYCERAAVRVDFRAFNVAVLRERGMPGIVTRLATVLSESAQRQTGTLGNAAGLVLGRFQTSAGTAGCIQAFYEAIRAGRPAPLSREQARGPVDLATAVWDALEKPGALSPALDTRSQVVRRRLAADFTAAPSAEPVRTLVTGGTGFIGSHLVRRLAGQGRRVRVLARPKSRLDGLPNDCVELSFGDLGDAESVNRAMQGIEVLYHLGATTGGDWATYFRDTVAGTRNVLEAAANAGVKKVVFVSSMGVLCSSRFPDNSFVNESFPVEQRPEARGDYSRAKLESERLAQEFARQRGLDLCILRPGLVFGPGRTEFLSDAGFQVSDGVALVVGMGGRRLGLNYVENLIDALVCAEQAHVPSGRIYNILDSDQPTVSRYIQSYRRASGKKMRAVYLPTTVWSLGFGVLDTVLGFVRHSPSSMGYRLASIAHGPQYDISAAERDLGWRPRYSFDEAMQRTYARAG